MVIGQNLRTVEEAAIRQNRKVYSLPRPSRHDAVIRYMVEQCGIKPPVTGEQGFVLDDGRFVDRVTAANLAMLAGQCSNLIDPPELCSEDLW